MPLAKLSKFRLSEDEIIRTPLDKTTEIPREQKRRSSGMDPKPPALWAAYESVDCEPAAVMGQYPRGFLDFIARVLHTPRPRILHLCSGSLPRGEGIRIDIRPEAHPDVLADAARCVPFQDESFDAVAIDPPYSFEYAEVLYGLKYPRPSRLLAEAARVLRPDGRIGILHFFVPPPPPGCTFERCYGVTTGCGYRIRAFTVHKKSSPGLFPDAADS